MSGTQTLLAEYVQKGSERAFRELVTSYINFVFSTALRVVGGDRQMAEDVSQTVFTDLARKAITLPRDVKLGGWLHRHTCFVGRKALRREWRRIARERQAMQLTTIEDYTEENLVQLSTILDETINGLGKEDRNAIILRFFEQLDYRALGAALGSSEDAARMRVSRALEKMGATLKRRGIAMSIAGLTFVLGTKSVAAAPAGLAIKVSQIALAESLKGWGALTVLKDACLSRVNLAIFGTAGVVGLIILLLPARQSSAALGIDKSQYNPADFADLTEEAETPSRAESDPPPVPVVVAANSTVPIPSQPEAVTPAVSKPPAIMVLPTTNSPAMATNPATASMGRLSGIVGGLANYGVYLHSPANSQSQADADWHVSRSQTIGTGYQFAPAPTLPAPTAPSVTVSRTVTNSPPQPLPSPGLTSGGPAWSAGALQVAPLSQPNSSLLRGNKGNQSKRQRQP